MVTSNAIRRTFHIKVGAQIATAFSIEVDELEYFVTAKHVLGSLAGQTKLEIYHDGRWKEIPIRVVGHAPDEIDVSVFVLPQRIVGRDLVLKPDAAGLYVSQDVYFLGFPFGLFGIMGVENSDYPVPYVKKGVVSCIEHRNQGIHCIFIDGHNNPGFSGGPVVFALPGTSSLQVASIIAAYRCEDQPVFHGATELPLSTRHNTGIVISYGINHAVALARANPLGTSAA